MALNLKIVRLLNGQELITEVLKENKEGIEIKNPVAIMMVPSKVDPTNPSIGLAPWCQFTDDDVFHINRTAIITMMEPIQEFKNQYNGMFGGIVAPPKGFILPE